jgi:hypothetical protein
MFRLLGALCALTLTWGLAACSARTTRGELSVAVVPTSAAVGTGRSYQFGAVVHGGADLAVTWSADCGTVDDTGLYVAPQDPATCHVVVASHADPQKSATAVVTVSTSPPSAWRPFSADSPWNTPIPASAELEPGSATLVANFIKSGVEAYGAHLDVNIATYSIPLYWADAGTPSHPVKAANGGVGWGGNDVTADMPIPDGAAPDPESDHHMLVVSADRTVEYGCWDVSHSASASPPWQAGFCATADLTGTGVRPPSPTNPWWLAYGARACGFPLVAGLIRVEEIQAGRIDHALVIAYPGILGPGFTPPASSPSISGVQSGGVPCGGRFQYDPSVDVTTLGLSRAGQIIVRALQEYGAYVGDFSGALSLYAESSPAAQAYWASGVLGTYELQDKLDLTRFRVIELGTVY